MTDKNSKYNIDDLFNASQKNNKLIINEIKKTNNQIYSQLESLSWLQRRLKLTKQLPPLRGWPVSPDFLLRLHTYIIDKKPQVVVETGSGATTLVIADALRQNGSGHLHSLEHLQFYGNQTQSNINAETLQKWVSIKISEITEWTSEHLNTDTEKPSKWYSINLLKNINNIDLLIVDGPPAGTCPYARYPALPATIQQLSPNAQIWMDDANRKDEISICEHWAETYDLNIEFIPLEKGLCVLSRKTSATEQQHKSLSQQPSSPFNFNIEKDQVG